MTCFISCVHRCRLKMAKCIVPVCTVKQRQRPPGEPPVSTFRFPRDPETKQKWIDNISPAYLNCRGKPLEPTQSSRYTQIGFDQIQSVFQGFGLTSVFFYFAECSSAGLKSQPFLLIARGKVIGQAR